MVRDQKKVENLFLIETVEMHGMPQLRYDQSVTQSFHQISAINILRTRLIFWQRLFEAFRIVAKWKQLHLNFSKIFPF